MSARPFEIICEIEPPVRPDLTHARHQIGVLTAVSSTFLIPDNHIGRATVSSIAVAHEVQAMGGHSIACVNSRDRNLLGFRRDLLTAAALPEQVIKSAQRRHRLIVGNLECAAGRAVKESRRGIRVVEHGLEYPLATGRPNRRCRRNGKQKFHVS